MRVRWQLLCLAAALTVALVASVDVSHGDRFSTSVARRRQTPDEVFEWAKAVPMYQWRRFVTLNQALNRFRSFPLAKAAAVAAAHALVAAGCGIQMEAGKDPVTNVEKVDALLAESSAKGTPAASKVVCLPDDHKDRAGRTKLAVTAAIVFAFRMQSAFAIPTSSDEFGYSEYALANSNGPTTRDLFVLKLEQLIGGLKEMDAAAKEVHLLAAHIFPKDNTTRAMNMFLDHMETLVGSIGSVVFTNLLLALPRQSPPNCVVQPNIVTGGVAFAKALQLAAGCEKGGDIASGLAKLADELAVDKTFQARVLEHRHVLTLLTSNYTFWKRVEREVELSKFGGSGKKKFSFVEVDKSKLVGLFQNHWRALSAVFMGTDFARNYAPACPCACKGAKPADFKCPVDVEAGPSVSQASLSPGQLRTTSKAGGFFAALQPDHPLQAVQVA